MLRDARGHHRVVVTGLGLVSPLGSDVDSFWKDVTSGVVATGPVTRFGTEGYPTHLACEVSDPSLTEPGAPGDTRVPRSVRYTRHAVDAALRDAGLCGHDARLRTGIVLGTVMGTRPHLEELRRQGTPIEGEPSWDAPQSLAREPAHRHGLRGPRHVVAAGCAAGNTAIAMAADHIRSGEADAMVAGGVDELSETVFQLFTTLRALAPDQVRPFDRNRRGMLPSEAAGCLVLESLEHATARGADILAELPGYAVAADAHHMTAPHPQGVGMMRCMEASLAQAGLAPRDVDYVSAHGTGTPANDSLEADCIGRFFASDRGRPAVSSIKGMLGHAQGGASALEAIVCVLALRHGRVPGNPTLLDPDDSCAGLDVIRGPARDMPVHVTLSNAFGFGGSTSAVVLTTFTG
ncbi:MULTISPECIES: beta-ketoacyl-[acyl-carrier-protein] synthase family protein [unclassified Streptomyces]|uniref:beta-ketoacyl-[acyl-carrier-protein] synthase family protein n=1 Tax=unclassified Streptomyces TaxID=2593676 RepID=UPI0022B60649|nr:MULTISPECIES: beta-ketoacyl-[acyl-carrier-protein] synthase family protein [unclassified Streptomyces]MCZ7416009.1 beta-ketoacyl-[acyl-carrier-protein] synthase family protein [Streptomyces sp. WMMC897]MCZ7434184.1 beta-ketoacyl-[acyl-carrier-protein] synthase family protein [Streptomyces sp. WMMC1477]